MSERGSSGRFRCDECKRVFALGSLDAMDDCGASHWFCTDCLEAMENRAAVIEARIERRNPRARPSSHYLFFEQRIVP